MLCPYQFDSYFYETIVNKRDVKPCFCQKMLRIDSFLIFILHQIDYQMLFHQLSLHVEEL